MNKALEQDLETFRTRGTAAKGGVRIVIDTSDDSDEDNDHPVVSRARAKRSFTSRRRLKGSANSSMIMWLQELIYVYVL